MYIDERGWILFFIYVIIRLMTLIKIFTTSTCPYCKMEKGYLDTKGIKYENIEVDGDEAAAKKLMEEEQGQIGVPFTEITKDDGTLVKILGFDQPKLDEALGISK